MILPLLASFVISQTADINPNMGFELTSMSYTAGGSLSTTDIGDDIAQLTVANSAAQLSNSAAAVAHYTITWTPTASESAPAAVEVSVARNYTFSATGTGTCGMYSADGSTIDSINGSDNFVNHNTALEDETYYTVTLAVQPDGTATGTLDVPTNNLYCTYDATGGQATSTTENLIISGFTRVNPVAELLKRRRSKVSEGLK